MIEANECTVEGDNAIEVLRKELGDNQTKLNELVARYNRLLRLYNDLFNAYLSLGD